MSATTPTETTGRSAFGEMSLDPSSPLSKKGKRALHKKNNSAPELFKTIQVSPQKRKRNQPVFYKKNIPYESPTENKRADVEQGMIEDISQRGIAIRDDGEIGGNMEGIVAWERMEKMEKDIEALKQENQTQQQSINKHERQLTILQPTADEAMNVTQYFFEQSGLGDFDLEKKKAGDKSAHVPNVHATVGLFDAVPDNVFRFGLEEVFGTGYLSCKLLREIPAWAWLANKRADLRYLNEDKRVKQTTDNDVIEEIDNFTHQLLKELPSEREATLAKGGKFFEKHRNLKIKVTAQMHYIGFNPLP